jgi:hypothetical protein
MHVILLLFVAAMLNEMQALSLACELWKEAQLSKE